MDFRISEDQQALVEGVRDYLTDAHGAEVLRALDAGESGKSEEIWQGLVEMGLPGLLVPESEGGLGLGLVDGVLIAVELGRAAVAEPIVDTAFVAVPWLVARRQTERLGDIASGSLTVALAHSINPWIADLDRAGHVIGGDAKSGEALETVDPLRRLSAASGEGEDELLLDLAALMSAAQLQGLGEAMIVIATDYAQNRNQFGQPIGSFQAVKHLLANVAVKTEFARGALLRAAQAMADGLPSAGTHVSHAKLATADAAILAAETAIQVHGAMGYTYEVDLHFWMKRAWALAGAWGDRAFHLARLDRAVIGGGLAIGPAHSFD